MSARSQTQSASGSVRGSVKFAGEEAKDKMYEPKHKKKVVRVLTVIAYVFSVSLAAIMLSMYYIFIWQGTKPSQHHHHQHQQYYHNQGECRPLGTGNNGLIQDGSQLSRITAYNDSQVAETPRALPVQEDVTTTTSPLSRFVQDYLSLQQTKKNFSHLELSTS